MQLEELFPYNSFRTGQRGTSRISLQHVQEEGPAHRGSNERFRKDRSGARGFNHGSGRGREPHHLRLQDQEAGIPRHRGGTADPEEDSLERGAALREDRLLSPEGDLQLRRKPRVFQMVLQLQHHQQPLLLLPQPESARQRGRRHGAGPERGRAKSFGTPGDRKKGTCLSL